MCTSAGLCKGMQYWRGIEHKMTDGLFTINLATNEGGCVAGDDDDVIVYQLYFILVCERAYYDTL